MIEIILTALIGAFFTWLFIAFWDKLRDYHRGPKITLEKITINAPDDFRINLRNKGSIVASECMVTLETSPLSEAKQFLRKFLKPTGIRMDYILEDERMSEVNILYSCWPITRDEILPDMTDMKINTAYEFMSYLPPFLERKKEKLKAGNWNKRISFPKEQGAYIAAISVYDGIDKAFILIYEYLDSKQAPRAKYKLIGTIQRARKIKIAFIRLKLWLFARRGSHL